MSVSGNYGVNLSFLNTSTANTAGNASETVSVPSGSSVGSGAFAAGTASKQADKIWSYANVAYTGATTFDLTSLTGPFGTVTFARVRLIYVENRDTNEAHTLTLGNAATNQWAGPLSSGTTTETVPGTGILLKVAPLTSGWVVDGTHKSLKVDAGANTISIEIVIVGASV